jgi:type IV secretory pathway ATPase VirB11/archaellum biosynthesis ATPase
MLIANAHGTGPLASPTRAAYLTRYFFAHPSISAIDFMKQLVIGIAGGTGSGKTTVTNAILQHLDPERIAVIQHDSYYKDISTHGARRTPWRSIWW